MHMADDAQGQVSEADVLTCHTLHTTLLAMQHLRFRIVNSYVRRALPRKTLLAREISW